MARRSGFAKKIDSVHWSLIQGASINQAAGSVAILMSAAQHLPETLLRIRGEWVSGFHANVANQVGVAVVCGLILVPEGTGSTVLWSPITDGDAPWIWWDAMHLMNLEAVADVVAGQEVLSGRRVIDSKAMRRVRNTELQMVVEQATLGALSAAAVTVSVSARVLAGQS